MRSATRILLPLIVCHLVGIRPAHADQPERLVVYLRRAFDLNIVKSAKVRFPVAQQNRAAAAVFSLVTQSLLHEIAMPPRPRSVLCRRGSVVVGRHVLMPSRRGFRFLDAPCRCVSFVATRPPGYTFPSGILTVKVFQRRDGGVGVSMPEPNWIVAGDQFVALEPVSESVGPEPGAIGTGVVRVVMRAVDESLRKVSAGGGADGGLPEVGE